MADTVRRKKLAFHMRQLSVGIISNDGFERAILDEITNGCLPEHYRGSSDAGTDDPVVAPILEVCWGLYGDLRNHKLKGPDQLSTENLKIIARCILFLHTDLEYEWPPFDTRNPIFSFSLVDFLIGILTLGQNIRNKRKGQLIAYEAFKKSGDFDHWPFYRLSDYENHLTKPPFLSKHRAS
jgi:hypothetical protein